MEVVSLLLHTPHLFPSLSSATLSTLANVLVGCYQGACQAMVALSALPAKRKETGVAGATVDAEKSKEGESKGEGGSDEREDEEGRGGREGEKR